MKKTLQGMLALALIVGSVSARTHTNKTFLRPRPVLRNRAMMDTTWNKQINQKGDGRFGGSLQVTGFYQASTNRSDIGKYFGGYDSTKADCLCAQKCNDCCTSCSTNCGSCNVCCSTSSQQTIQSLSLKKLTKAACCSICNGSGCSSCNNSCDSCTCNGCGTCDFCCNDCDSDKNCCGCAFDTIFVDNTQFSSDITDLAGGSRDLASFDIFQNPWAALGANLSDSATANSDAEKALFFGVNPGGTVQLRPEQNVWGFRLDYFQDLDKIVNGLYFRLSTAVVNTETCVNPRLCNGNQLTNQTISDQDADGYVVVHPVTDAQFNDVVFDFGENAGRTVLDYFSGCLAQTTNAVSSYTDTNGMVIPVATTLVQDHLCKLTIPCDCDDETALADIELVVGYNIINQEHRHVGFNLGVVFPTGNDAESRRLFEPISGNGNFWAFGAGFDTSFNLFRNDSWAIDLNVVLDYRFLFEDTQERVLGFKNSSGTVVNHGWYRLFGKVGESRVFPGANVLCCKVDVEPGSQVDFIASLDFDYSGFNFTIGYNLFAQESEDVCLNNKCCCWTDNTYGLIGDTYDPAIAGAVTLSDFENVTGNMSINTTDLCTQPAETPSQVTHKLYGGVGYAWNDWDYPLMLGTGASFEWVESNAAVEQWAIWGKVGVSF